VIAPFLISLLAVLGFALGLWKAGVASAAGTLFATAMRGVGAMFDSELDDDAKEVAVRRAGIALLGRSLDLALRFALALAAAALPVYLAAFLGIASPAAVFALMLRIDYILGVSLAAILLGRLLARRRALRAPPAGGTAAYGPGDQLVHVLAFASPAVMRTLAAIDDRLHARAIRQVEERPPVFVTSLARGGTTALLNAFHDLPGIATHEYRDMPFITAPAAWARLGGDRSARVGRRERAHGDGLQIGFDSPEAFDEVLWRLYWPEKYAPSGIGLWQAGDIRPPAREVLRRHFAKIVLLRRTGRAARGGARYLSKNNANIARLRLLPGLFPGCDIVVPVRQPGPHAASLLRQHRNFLRQHAEDGFVRRYMADIGHYEFGQIHRPVRFPGFDPARHDTDSGDYWLQYWIAAFREVLAQAGSCRFVFQDDLRARPQETMAGLCRALDVESGGAEFSGYFRAGPDRTPPDLFAPDLLAEAEAVYAGLVDAAASRRPRGAL
jgi:hypothetical protein